MDERICVRMSRGLRGHLEGYAKERCSKISEAARTLIEHGIRNRHIKDIELLHGQTNELLIQLKRVGVNINQIAHHMNANGQHDGSMIIQELTELRSLLDTSLKVLRNVSHELGS